MKRRSFKMLAAAILLTMSTCFYCATLADFTVTSKIFFGIATVLLYALLNILAYFIEKRKNPQLRFTAYLLTFFYD